MAQAKESTIQFLAPPKLAAIKNGDVAARVRMERSASLEIREERAELQEAAEQTLNVIIDLGSDGSVRWVSPSWTHVIGTNIESIEGQGISAILYDQERNPFLDALRSMQKDDSRSHIVRFRTRVFPQSILYNHSDIIESPVSTEGEEIATPELDHIITLEGQGIMINGYDRTVGDESHVSLTPPMFPTHLTNWHRLCGCFALLQDLERLP